MSDLSIELQWQRAEPVFAGGTYSNADTVQMNRLYDIAAGSAPDFGGDPANVNPEQALASAMPSCHMMTLLTLAAKVGWAVASYHDDAEAYLGKNPEGQMSVTRIDLHPVVRFDTGVSVNDAQSAEMQDRAHRYRFIANTLAESVEINTR